MKQQSVPSWLEEKKDREDQRFISCGPRKAARSSVTPQGEARALEDTCLGCLGQKSWGGLAKYNMFSLRTWDRRAAGAGQLDRKDTAVDAAGGHTRPARISNRRGKEMRNLEETENHPNSTDFTLNWQRTHFHSLPGRTKSWDEN